MSASLHIETDRVINPLDVLEQIIAGNEWVFERRSDEEMAAEAPGKWCDYGLHFSWSSEMSAMAFTCAFDLKVPAARREKLYELLALANDRLWIGHFGIESEEGVPVFGAAAGRAGRLGRKPGRHGRYRADGMRTLLPRFSIRAVGREKPG